MIACSYDEIHCPAYVQSPVFASLVFPRFLYRFLDPFRIFSSIVFVEVGSFNVGRRASVRIIE